MLTRIDLEQLAQHLPPLRFDGSDLSTGQAEAYLDYYGINFDRDFAGLRHGFGYFQADEFRVVAQYWLPSNPCGTLVVVHGYYDHMGIFGHPIRWALEQNLAVLAFDLPGHGLSSGETAAIDSFDQYGDVLAKLLQLAGGKLPQPLYALGQSTGGAVILNYLWRARDSLASFKGIALCAPLVVPRGWRGYYSGRFLYAVLRHCIKRLPRGVSHSSHDQQFNDFVNSQDPLQSRYLSLRWVGAMKAWHDSLRQFAPLQLELLIVQGSKDMTVDWRYNLALLQRKLPNASVQIIENAGHQLVNEREDLRSQVFTAVHRYFFTPSNI